MVGTRSVTSPVSTESTVRPNTPKGNSLPGTPHCLSVPGIYRRVPTTSPSVPTLLWNFARGQEVPHYSTRESSLSTVSVRHEIKCNPSIRPFCLGSHPVPCTDPRTSPSYLPLTFPHNSQGRHPPDRERRSIVGVPDTGHLVSERVESFPGLPTTSVRIVVRRPLTSDVECRGSRSSDRLFGWRT